jgi:hypothetical protein
MRSTTASWRGKRFAVASIGAVAALAMCAHSAVAAITTASDTATVGSGTTEYVDVDCPGSSVAVSAGFRVGGFSTVNGGVLPTASRITYTASPSSSSVFGVNSSGSDGTLTDYAYCDTEPRDIVWRFAAVVLSPGTSRTMTANCPSGTQVIGGGFVAGYDDQGFITYRSQKFENGWRISVHSPPGTDSSYVHSLATCQDHGPLLETRVARATTNPAQYHGIAAVQPTCPPATRPISGGFDGHVVGSPSPGVAPLVSRRLADGWRLSGWSVSPTVDAKLTGFVYCEPL